MVTDSAEKWILSARDGFCSDYGLPRGLALAAATALYHGYVAFSDVMPDPLQAVSDHMRSDEAPLVDLHDFPEPHLENF